MITVISITICSTITSTNIYFLVLSVIETSTKVWCEARGKEENGESVERYIPSDTSV